MGSRNRRSNRETAFASQAKRKPIPNGRKRRRNPGSLLFETLEAKRLLNARPVALDDLAYFTPLNTALTISQSADGVSANDFDAEGS